MKPLFEVNQRVVFVPPKIIRYQEGVPQLIEGEIYKVSNPCLEDQDWKRVMISLYEHPGFCYDQTAFRPVDESFGEFVEHTVLKQAILEEQQT